jgi:CRP-like cAMP-binding protein
VGSPTMNAEDLRRLQTVGGESRFGAGHVLIERGHTGTGLYVLLEGTVVVEAPEGNRELGPGAFIGERALFAADGKRTARVRAATELRVLAVDRAQFNRLCADDPEFARRLADA